MIRRLLVPLALIGAGWYLYTRYLKPKQVALGDADSERSDEQRGIMDRVGQAAGGVAQTAARAAQVPIERARSLVGGGEQAPAGERASTPESSTDEDAATAVPRGDATADARREQPPAPPAERPAAGASLPAPSAPRQAAGATTPAATGAGNDEQPEAEAETERTIKGNVRADGEKIYHLPGDPAYERTNPEQWFASVEEAEAAGFRRAGRPQG